MLQVFRWLGVVLGALSVFFLVHRALGFGLATAFEDIRAAYVAIFHPIAEMFGPSLRWIAGQLGVQLPVWWREAIVLYAAVGAALSRFLLIASAQAIDELRSVPATFRGRRPTRAESIARREEARRQYEQHLKTQQTWATAQAGLAGFVWPAVLVGLTALRLLASLLERQPVWEVLTNTITVPLGVVAELGNTLAAVVLLLLTNAGFIAQ